MDRPFVRSLWLIGTLCTSVLPVVPAVHAFVGLEQNKPVCNTAMQRTVRVVPIVQMAQRPNTEMPVVSVAPSITASMAVTTANDAVLLASFSPWEQWFVYQLKDGYDQALSIKCPFFRRRAADLLDASDMIVRFIVYRHKSLPFSPPGWKLLDDTVPKQTGISSHELLECIRLDWKEATHKGYYVTGKLTTSIYRDDVVFDGPDPDMPVRGLRKYLNAASQLFDQGKTRSELLSLDLIVPQPPHNHSLNDNHHHHHGTATVSTSPVIVATWKMQGVLRLPWKPAVPEWTGTTTYYTDEDGLIYRHVETWDKSVGRAFLETLFPAMAKHIWKEVLIDTA